MNENNFYAGALHLVDDETERLPFQPCDKYIVLESDSGEYYLWPMVKSVQDVEDMWIAFAERHMSLYKAHLIEENLSVYKEFSGFSLRTSYVVPSK